MSAPARSMAFALVAMIAARSAFADDPAPEPAPAPVASAPPAPVDAPPASAPPPEPQPPAPAPATVAPEVKAPPPPAKCSIAVLDLEAAEGVVVARATSWTDALVQEMQAHSGCSVLSRADIRAVISLEAEKSLLGCDEQSCLAELGGALGVSDLVTGRISRIQGSMLLSLRRTNLKTMQVTSRATDTFTGEDDEVFAFVSWLARKLVIEDPAKVGEKPIPHPKKTQGPQLVERRGTIWGTLAWTGVVLTSVSLVVLGAGAATTELLSENTASAKLSPQDNRSFLNTAAQVGPISATVTNGALYASGVLLVATVGMFFLPGEELTRVDVVGAQ